MTRIPMITAKSAKKPRTPWERNPVVLNCFNPLAMMKTPKKRTMDKRKTSSPCPQPAPTISPPALLQKNNENKVSLRLVSYKIHTCIFWGCHPDLQLLCLCSLPSLRSPPLSDCANRSGRIYSNCIHKAICCSHYAQPDKQSWEAIQINEQHQQTWCLILNTFLKALWIKMKATREANISSVNLGEMEGYWERIEDRDLVM